MLIKLVLGLMASCAFMAVALLAGACGGEEEAASRRPDVAAIAHPGSPDTSNKVLAEGPARGVVREWGQTAVISPLGKQLAEPGFDVPCLPGQGCEAPVREHGNGTCSGLNDTPVEEAGARGESSDPSRGGVVRKWSGSQDGGNCQEPESCADGSCDPADPCPPGGGCANPPSGGTGFFSDTPHLHPRLRTALALAVTL